MKKISKGIFSILLTSAIVVSGALSCSAMNSKRWLYQYKYDKQNNHVTRTYDYYTITVTWPEGHTFVDEGTSDKVINKIKYPFQDPYYVHQVTYLYRIV